MFLKEVMYSKKSNTVKYIYVVKHTSIAFKLFLTLYS